MGRVTGLIVLGIALTVAACQPATSATTPPVSAPDVVYRMQPLPGPTPSKDVTSSAVDVLQSRLRSLDVGTFTAGAGEAITFNLPATVDDSAVRAVLTAPGEVSFVPLGPSAADTAAEGQPVPGGLTPLFGSEMIAGATLDSDSNGQPAVAIQLNAAGTRAFAAYTTTHIGDAFAIVLDGRIVVMPIVMGAITEGAVTISGPFRGQSIPIPVLVAILASGPLPPAWQHAAVSRP